MFAFTLSLLFPNSMPVSSSELRSATVCTFPLQQYKTVYLWIRVCLSENDFEVKFSIVSLCVVVPCSLVARYQHMSRKYPQNYVRAVPSLCCYAPVVPLPGRQSWKPQITRTCACLYTFVFFPKHLDQIRSPPTGDHFPKDKAAGP
jgi:hypothetical protein